MLDRGGPPPIAAELTAGYVAAYPLRATELRALYDFVRLRLALSVTLSAYQQALRPDDPYLSVSEAPAWRLLERLAADVRTRQRFTAAIMQAGGTT
jgi:Ser/Thr protein kinase RdoA (MazF antagonist)